jgi:hypothetical protein
MHGRRSRQQGRYLALKKRASAANFTRRRSDIGARKPRRFNLYHGPAQPDPGKGFVAVRRIFNPINADTPQPFPKVRAGNTEKRSENPAPLALRYSRHGRQTIKSAAFLETQQEGLSLVILSMGYEEMKDPSRPTPIAKKAISHVARRGLKPGARPCTFVSQNNMFDARGGKSSANPHRFGRRTKT